MNVAQETLGLRRGSLSLPLSLLMSAFALPIPPGNLTIPLRRPTERSPTARAIPEAHSPRVVVVRQTCLAGRRQTFIKGEGAGTPFPLKECAAVSTLMGAWSAPRCGADKRALSTLMGAWSAPRCGADKRMSLGGLHAPAASVCSLSPVTSSAQDDSTSELLRFL